MSTTVKMFLALVVGIAAGVLVSQSMKKEPVPCDPFAQVMAALDSVNTDVLRDTITHAARYDARHKSVSRLMNKLGGGPIGMECLDRPTKHISAEEAKDFIDRYQKGPLQLYTHIGDMMPLLQGWFIERDTIEKVWSRHPEANGLQLYLARKDVQGYDPMTIVWMGRHRLLDQLCGEYQPNGRMSLLPPPPGSGAEDERDEAYWGDSYEYLQPCPPNCPPR